jgi:hypothetical protein
MARTGASLGQSDNLGNPEARVDAAVLLGDLNRGASIGELGAD